MNVMVLLSLLFTIVFDVLVLPMLYLNDIESFGSVDIVFSIPICSPIVYGGFQIGILFFLIISVLFYLLTISGIYHNWFWTSSGITQPRLADQTHAPMNDFTVH